MTVRTKATVASTFETGDRPTQQQFADFIDSAVFIPSAGATGIIEVESTASSTARDLGTSVGSMIKLVEIEGVPGISFASGAVVRRTTTNTADIADFRIRRTADYTGGTVGFVNAALRTTVTAGSAATSYEWASVTELVNLATAAASAENVGLYAKATKIESGKTWACNFVMRDQSGSDPTTQSILMELNHVVVGTDTNQLRNTIDILPSLHSGGSGTITNAIRIVGQNNVTYTTGLNVAGTVTTPILIQGTHTTGIDMRTGTYSTAAFRVSENDLLMFTDSGVVRMRYNSTSGDLEFYNSNNSVINVSLDMTTALGSGAIKIAGGQVLRESKTGWGTPTGTLTRTSFDESTVTLPQLAQRVAALITDLKTHHGMLGA